MRKRFLINFAFLEHIDAVSAADDGNRAVFGGFNHCIGNGVAALGEIRELKHAHGAVPENRFAFEDFIGKQLFGFGADVQAFHVGRNGVGHHGFSRLGKFFGNAEVHRHQHFDAFGLRFGHNLVGFFNFAFVQQGFAHFHAFGFEESIGHAAADNQHIDFVQQVVKQHDFVGHFGPADNGRKRAGRIIEGFA